MRLVNILGVNSTSSPCDDVYFGGVEFFNRGQWGRVCFGFQQQSVSFTLDALVICRQLGFPYGGVYASGQPDSSIRRLAPRVSVTQRSAAPEPLVWLTDVRCKGTEDRLDECILPELASLPDGASSECSFDTDDSAFLGVVCRRFTIAGTTPCQCVHEPWPPAFVNSVQPMKNSSVVLIGE